jgi:hypothetical protein
MYRAESSRNCPHRWCGALLLLRRHAMLDVTYHNFRQAIVIPTNCIRVVYTGRWWISTQQYLLHGIWNSLRLPKIKHALFLHLACRD